LRIMLQNFLADSIPSKQQCCRILRIQNLVQMGQLTGSRDL
jgi:hypothetical protein